jgi:predicted ester cyclase
VRAQREIFGGGEVGLVDELIAPGCVDHSAPPGTPAGPEGIRATVGWLHSVFDELDYEIEDVFGAGDRVAVRATFSGVHSGELFGNAPTGRRFSVSHIHVYRVEDGRIAEHWATRDDLGMMRQLGLAG